MKISTVLDHILVSSKSHVSNKKE